MRKDFEYQGCDSAQKKKRMICLRKVLWVKFNLLFMMSAACSITLHHVHVLCILSKSTTKVIHAISCVLAADETMVSMVFPPSTFVCRWWRDLKKSWPTGRRVQSLNPQCSQSHFRPLWKTGDIKSAVWIIDEENYVFLKKWVHFHLNWVP